MRVRVDHAADVVYLNLERIPFGRINALRSSPRKRGPRLKLTGRKTGSPPSRGRTEWWYDSVQTRHALTDRAIKDSEEVADGIIVDYDAEGRIVGVEILDASNRTNDPSALRQFSFEIPTVE